MIGRVALRHATSTRQQAPDAELAPCRPAKRRSEGPSQPTKRLPRVAIAGKYVNMTDVNAPPLPGVSDARNPGGKVPTDEAGVGAASDGIVSTVELLYFAYRDFTGDADALLAEIGFGRAHHRVLHFIGRNPGLRVADLLDILRITKQSLARVLKQLVDSGYVAQAAGEYDRRERRLHLTSEGSVLTERLLAMQERRIARALTASPPGTRETVERFLFAMIDADQQGRVSEISGGGRKPMSTTGESNR